MNRSSKPISAELGISAIDLIRYHLLAAKVPLCLLVAFSSFFGFALSAHQLGWQAWIVFTSVFLLACGGASLNSYQEHRWDRLMQRTRRRPVAMGVLSPIHARRQGQVLAGAGLFLLYLGTLDPAPISAGAVALCLYNVAYTPLKYKTIWAIIPGAVCGAIPPYIGWLAGGGALFSPVILGGVILLIIWQIPHFWLVMLSNKGDYSRLPLPSLGSLVPESNLRLISIVWVASLVTVIHTLIVMFAVMPATIRIMISIVSLAVLIVFSLQMAAWKKPRYRFLFILLNSFMLYTMALFTVGSIVV